MPKPTFSAKAYADAPRLAIAFRGVDAILTIGGGEASLSPAETTRDDMGNVESPLGPDGWARPVRIVPMTDSATFGLTDKTLTNLANKGCVETVRIGDDAYVVLSGNKITVRAEGTFTFADRKPVNLSFG